MKGSRLAGWELLNWTILLLPGPLFPGRLQPSLISPANRGRVKLQRAARSTTHTAFPCKTRKAIRFIMAFESPSNAIIPRGVAFCWWKPFYWWKKIMERLQLLAVVFVIRMAQGFVAGVAAGINNITSWPQTFPRANTRKRKKGLWHKDKRICFSGTSGKGLFKSVMTFSLVCACTK